ncbi:MULTISPECIES: mechanosensitive ion channel family protein [Oceanospirillaceae]|jgi:small conductance mechanosensitive channel|uniref:mechanosensitive ion channel family protein n=1 Tax=Oceanospirillaceae TaxID=135620 RepID=UPI000C4CF7BD|nr:MULTISPECIES: mechanosensitive ion channel domain-containing protein [Thalassolituus]PIQ40761.1 MAG: mechanosensitive ion channel protein MscS [Thalassolituus sp. CG17_big_fil_post_rev_8_21_14_2_50_53_8]MCA6059089.1 mechanosensitive ion channel [Thalassolituus sp. ST750PaO-4]MCB2387656.1 mechanosensitive ion channel [Thalassolituus alkanivorans]MCB2424942.1 mechanosensitive ion channel [Thalassolituus alkanivorans]TVV44570.1 mechanosensitive ion channel [Thalassolituus sp. C2-1]
MNWTFTINPQQLWETYILPWGTQIVLALLIFIIGRMLAGFVTRTTTKALERARLDPILISFLATVMNSTLVLLVIVFALSQLGLDTTSLVALLGAAGLAVGLALKDSLSHFAAGVMLIVFRPFKLGDYVEVGGVAGSVDKITIFSTRLKTPDNKVVTVPNGNVFGNTMINYSEEATRRIDMVIGISYGSDLLKAKSILEELVKDHDKVLKDPAYKIAVSELADSSVNFIVRPWVKAEDYWDVRFQLTESIKLRFDAEGIEIPFPQMDVHWHKDVA